MLPKGASVTVKKLSHWIKVTLQIFKKSSAERTLLKQTGQNKTILRPL